MIYNSVGISYKSTRNSNIYCSVCVCVMCICKCRHQNSFTSSVYTIYIIYKLQKIIYSNHMCLVVFVVRCFYKYIINITSKC